MPKGISRDQSVQHQILHRLKISSGHLDKVIKMTQNQAYCLDIIHQSQAIQKALKETDKIILANHLRTCTADSFKRGKTEEAVEEVMRVMEKI